jgi:hypothetical protein
MKIYELAPKELTFAAHEASSQSELPLSCQRAANKQRIDSGRGVKARNVCEWR